MSMYNPMGYDRPGRRALYQEAESSATCDAPNKAERMAIVRLLVGEEGLDVNSTDTDGLRMRPREKAARM